MIGAVILLGLFYWLLIVWVAWLIGRRKGRQIDSILFGAVLGPLGWLVVYMLPPSFPPCPRCGSPHKRDYPICHACGRPVPVMIACPSCQMGIDAADLQKGPQACPHCREQFEIA